MAASGSRLSPRLGIGRASARSRSTATIDNSTGSRIERKFDASNRISAAHPFAVSRRPAQPRFCQVCTTTCGCRHSTCRHSCREWHICNGSPLGQEGLTRPVSFELLVGKPCEQFDVSRGQCPVVVPSASQSIAVPASSLTEARRPSWVVRIWGFSAMMRTPSNKALIGSLISGHARRLRRQRPAPGVGHVAVGM